MENPIGRRQKGHPGAFKSVHMLSFGHKCCELKGAKHMLGFISMMLYVIVWQWSLCMPGMRDPDIRTTSISVGLRVFPGARN